MTSSKDNGDWLSAQQAVQADGSERENLPLINKKLPPLAPNLAPNLSTDLASNVDTNSVADSVSN
jgi:hypothetical protein